MKETTIKLALQLVIEDIARARNEKNEVVRNTWLNVSTELLKAVAKNY